MVDRHFDDRPSVGEEEQQREEEHTSNDLEHATEVVHAHQAHAVGTVAGRESEEEEEEEDEQEEEEQGLAGTHAVAGRERLERYVLRGEKEKESESEK